MANLVLRIQPQQKLRLPGILCSTNVETTPFDRDRWLLECLPLARGSSKSIFPSSRQVSSRALQEEARRGESEGMKRDPGAHAALKNARGPQLQVRILEVAM